ncbi:hypothetical protein E2542_SST04716 [Spatholobus suberectus]|nr:hypothetical protein E2542_SST04716 [Spatholobus suberectus]
MENVSVNCELRRNVELQERLFLVFVYFPLFHGEIQTLLPLKSKSLITNTKSLWTKTLRFHSTHNLRLNPAFSFGPQVEIMQAISIIASKGLARVMFSSPLKENH